MTHLVRSWRMSRTIRSFALIALFGAATQFLLSQDSGVVQNGTRQTKIIGSDRLVSVEPLPETDGEFCPPAGPPESLMAGLQPQSEIAGAAVASLIPSSSILPQQSNGANRAPVRVIHDNYPTYSAITVDHNSSLILLQDENLFGIKVFDRLTNTPRTAQFSEPKRILGGSKTKLEFNCGLYIDPKTGDIYSIANDTVDTMVVFPRTAEGNVAPARELHTPHRTYGIAVDEDSQELFLTVEQPPAVVVYHKMAKGEEKPIRTIKGDRTKLADPHGIAIDTKNQWMFVSNHGAVTNIKKDGDGVVPGTGRYDPPSISVYPLKAQGDAAPLWVIQGPKTKFNWPAHISIDQERGELYVANDVGDSILVFRATDKGDVAPIRVIKGPNTGLKNPVDVYVDVKNNELLVANMGNHAATVYPLTANGDVSPLRTIRSAPLGKMAMAIGNPGGVAYDSKRDELLVPN